ncbi:hypothetical protein AWP73_22335 [Escherichia coli]|nr:hypothetical protein AWP73_22335 [Escherichia coli]
MRDLILQLSKSSIYSTKPVNGKRDSKMRVYYAGCGANALSGPQNPQIQLIASPCRPDKRSASGNASRF